MPGIEYGENFAPFRGIVTGISGAVDSLIKYGQFPAAFRETRFVSAKCVCLFFESAKVLFQKEPMNSRGELASVGEAVLMRKGVDGDGGVVSAKQVFGRIGV